MNVAEMMWWMFGHTRDKRIKNEIIWNKVGVVPNENKMCVMQLR